MEGRKLAKTIVMVSMKTLVLVLILVCLYFAGKTAYDFGVNIFDEKSMETGEGHEVSVTIPEGSSAMDIAKILESNNLVESATLFYTQARLSDYYNGFVAGTYTLSTSMTPTEIMEIIAPEPETTSAED